MHSTTSAVLLGAALAILPAAAFAQGYPNGQIRMIVPVPAGGRD
jgi:tripartite-type tricarboxylate transporter receptor subunit TctC